MCKRKGELTEYLGSKLTFNCNDDGKGTIKFTQPVLIKKLNEEYKILTVQCPRHLQWLVRYL